MAEDAVKVLPGRTSGSKDRMVGLWFTVYARINLSYFTDLLLDQTNEKEEKHESAALTNFDFWQLI